MSRHLKGYRLVSIMSPQAPGVERLLTPAEVADICRVDLRTVAAWRRAGLLPAVQLPSGTVWRFRHADVKAIVDAPPASEVTA